MGCLGYDIQEAELTPEQIEKKNIEKVKKSAENLILINT